MKKVVLIFGTRPEAIKLAPVYLELSKRRDDFQPLMWCTGQHREMLDQVMDIFNLKADKDFAIMAPDQTLTFVTTSILQKLEKAFLQDRPDCILIQGDTTTVFAASLAAFYAKIQIGHVEAGLRTNQKYSPFPEEINRRLATHLADFHFAPTQKAKTNLLAENISKDHIWITGNTVIDALDIIVIKVRNKRPNMPEGIPVASIEAGKRMILITGHRRESFGKGFESLCRAIAELSKRYLECEFVYPVHLNPNVREPVYRILGNMPNIHLLEPMEYESFVWTMDNCYFILSDSGGVQEEASHLNKPVLVMRNTTERPEAIGTGTGKLVGTDFDTIIRESSLLLDNENLYMAMSKANNPFGDGYASVRIADILAEQISIKIP